MLPRRELSPGLRPPGRCPELGSAGPLGRVGWPPQGQRLYAQRVCALSALSSCVGPDARRVAASLASEKEERLPDRSLRAPVSMVPALASDVVSRIEKLGHEDVAESADGEERGGFH